MATTVVFSGQFPIGQTITDVKVIPAGTTEVTFEVTRTGWPNTTSNILTTSIQAQQPDGSWAHVGGGGVNGEGNAPKYDDAVVFSQSLLTDTNMCAVFDASVTLQTVIKVIT